MNLRWQLPDRHIKVSPALLEAAGGRTVLARLLAMRGMTEPHDVRGFLHPQHYTPADAATLHDLPKGADRLEAAIQKQDKILVWGDFDVDGQTSTALLVSALEQLGAVVDYHIPVRAVESHGIKPEFLQTYLDAGIDILLSCDTGIAAVEAVALANAHNVDVVITDHHDLPETLPAAYASINPKFHNPDHPLYSLPGVGVAYKLIEELYRRAGRSDEVQQFLDLTAMGIVADIAHQTKDTRFLLQLGLDVLRGTDREGLKAIMALGKVDGSRLIDEDIGFQIGPRLNAVGRLGDANVSVPLLTTDNQVLAKEIADKLEALNRDRRYKTSVVYDSAIAQIEREPSLLQYAVLVLSNPEWHQGVIGIVASRLVEEFGKPAILLASPEGEPVRGSARSVEGYHITEAIASQAEYLLGFGGHPMAAGMALEAEDIDRFRRGVSKAIIAQRQGKAPVASINISLDIPLAAVDLDLADEVELLAPFGAGNPPVNYLCRNVSIVDQKLFGQDLAHRKLFVSSDGCEPREIIWWGGAGEALPEGEIDLVFRMRPGHFREKRTLQITLLDFKRSNRKQEITTAATYEVVDYRGKDQRVLNALLDTHHDLQIWGEVGPAIEGMKDRTQLESAETLVLWTLPPNRHVLKEGLDVVQPSTVYIFGQPSAMDVPVDFLKRLVGIAKFVTSNFGGRVPLEKLAASTAQSIAAVRFGLEQLASLGVYYTLDEDGVVSFRVQEKSAPPEAAAKGLGRVLKETAAFRKAFKTTEDLAKFVA